MGGTAIDLIVIVVYLVSILPVRLELGIDTRVWLLRFAVCSIVSCLIVLLAAASAFDLGTTTKRL